MLKTQNLCCPREGRVNTKWKLVRRPGREMGSKNIIWGTHFLTTSIFKPLYFLKWHPIFDNFYSTDRKIICKLFNGLVVGFGPRGTL